MRRLSEVVEMLAHQSPNDCWASVMQTSEHEAIYDITWSSLQTAVAAFSTFMESELKDNAKGRKTLAYFAASDVRCAAAIVAAIKTETELLLLSSRNSQDINRGLLDATSCKDLLYSSEYRQHAYELSNSLPGLQGHELGTHQDYFETGSMGKHGKPQLELDQEKTALILHSSGTTGRPKPVRITYGAIAHMDKISAMPSPDGRSNKYDEMFSNKTMVGALPFFHVMGLVLLARSIYSQGRLVLLPSNKPPTAKVMITAIRQARPSSAILVPSMLKDICNIDEGLDVLSSLQDVWYGGGPLDRACGDKVSRVTRLLCGYGSTEMMTVFTLLPCRAEDWEYLEWHPEAGVVMEEVTDTTSEMIIKRKSKSEWQSVFYNFPQLSEWRSDDLFERHPSNVKLWRHIGRKDDLLVLSNGEKINPTGIEASIGQHPMVRDALIFGSGRFQVGVLLEVDEEQNKQNDDNRIGQIWPTIDKTNKTLPGHAKIWESMIIFATLEKPFERNLKGSIKRQATLELYETEIEKLYETQSKQPDEQFSSQDESNCSLQLRYKVIGLVKSVLQYESDPAVDQDLFDLGLDSLKALELAKRIEESIVGDNTESQHCDTETIYTYPTIEKLAGAISGEADKMEGPYSTNKGFQPSGEETMSSLVHKYTRLLDESPRSNSQMKLTFVLTGSTGQLGSYVLAHLLTTQAANKIYCFNRSEDAKARQRSRFQNMGLNADDLLDARVEFVCCTFDVDKLGLSADQFDDVRRSMTHFIHCAWPVDFKKSIETFEKTAIIGMVNCINFVAGAKHDPKFVFISSIASVGNWPAICGTADQEHCLVPERHITDNSCPSRQGYGESKHVATCILASAVQTLDIRATVVRVGQLCGPQDGSTEWKKSEWFPTLIESSLALRKLPSSLGNHSIDWVPIDIAASTIVDISVSREASQNSSTNDRENEPLQCYNLVNPSEADYDDLLCAVQEYYQNSENQDNITLETVELGKWIEDLEDEGNNSQKADKLPALKLLQFFKDINVETSNTLRFSLDNSLRVSSTLNNLGRVGKKDMKRWLSDWNFKTINS